MTAFYDDSGEFNPHGRKYACFGMNVVPVNYIRELNDAWSEVIEAHIQTSSSLQVSGIEVKSSELHAMPIILSSKKPLNDIQQKMLAYGLNTPEKANKLIEAVWEFLGNPPVSIRYLAVIANKSEVWCNFRPTQFNQWETSEKSGEKEKAKNLCGELEAFLIRHTYEFLLQRLQYLSRDPDFDFTDSFVVGDESSSAKVMLKTQAVIQAGLGKFTTLPTIVNRSWFCSSLYEPCLQIADWVAFAVRKWAEGKGTMNSYFLNTANSNIIQSPITFEPTEKAFNRCAPVVEDFPFPSLWKQRFLMAQVYLDNRFSSPLSLNHFA